MTYTASVIIPVYNAEKTIVRCVESIIYGSYKNLEVILVEDCSTDQSWRTCCRLAKKFENVSCYQNERNSGVSYTRNQGLQKAKGTYVLFVDSDDWVSGRYAEHLIRAAEANQDAMVACGCHFLDYVSESRRDFVWEENGAREYSIQQEHFPDLSAKFLLQQLWNKIFRREIIEEFLVRFDEMQSMGEDYQFVLDYLKAGKIRKCVVLNEALYFYIRANNTSLMSKFGLEENQNKYRRFDQLLQVSAIQEPTRTKMYNKLVSDVKASSVYQCVHATHLSKKQKLDLIERVMQDGNARLYYRSQFRIRCKEEIYSFGKKGKICLERKIQGEKNRHRIKHMRKELACKDFTIISQNCIGGIFYHDMGMQFLSPTINLYFQCPDFVKFAQNLKHYMQQKLRMTWGDGYPVGYLDDVPIYFMHYETCEEALKKWEERKQRIRWDRIIIFCTDRDGFDNETYEEWKKIPYPKILFSARQRDEELNVCFPQYIQAGCVPDLIPKREFYKDGEVVRYLNEQWK